ncbi:MAG: NAD(+)/NADH kinase [Candidatus Dormibacteria bacterium]
MSAAAQKGSIGFLLHLRESSGSAPLRHALELARDAGFEPLVVQVGPEGPISRHADSLRLLVAIGGDGTLLFAARMAAPLGIPLLGVNRGQLGFLTSVELDGLPAAITAFVDGTCRTDLRRTLRAAITAPDGKVAAVELPMAVNEVAVKADGFNLIRMRVTTDHQLVGEFDADGLIIATSSGSTAYSLSAGGPPLDPAVPALVLTALNPHALIGRSLVIPDTLEVVVEVRRGGAGVAADGRAWGRMGAGSRLVVAPGRQLAFIQPPGTPGFFERLRAKTGFGTVLKLPYVGDRSVPAAVAPDPDGPARD